MSAKILVIFNNKGGVGKTSVALNLAYTLMRNHKQRVLLVDSDSQGSLSAITSRYDRHKDFARLQKNRMSLGAAYLTAVEDEAAPDLAPVIREVNDSLLPYTVPEDRDLPLPYFGLIHGLLDLQNAEQALTGNALGPYYLRTMFKENTLITDFYDVIVIDLPPSLGMLVVNALYAASHVVIPVATHDQYGADQLTNTFKILARIAKIPEASFKVLGLLQNFHDGRRRVNRAIVKQLQGISKATYIPILKTSIPSNTNIGEAVTFRTSVVSKYPKTKGAEAFVKLGQEFRVLLHLTPNRKDILHD